MKDSSRPFHSFAEEHCDAEDDGAAAATATATATAPALPETRSPPPAAAPPLTTPALAVVVVPIASASAPAAKDAAETTCLLRRANTDGRKGEVDKAEEEPGMKREHSSSLPMFAPSDRLLRAAKESDEGAAGTKASKTTLTLPAPRSMPNFSLFGLGGGGFGSAVDPFDGDKCRVSDEGGSNPLQSFLRSAVPFIATQLHAHSDESCKITPFSEFGNAKPPPARSSSPPSLTHPLSMALPSRGKLTDALESGNGGGGGNGNGNGHVPPKNEDEVIDEELEDYLRLAAAIRDVGRCADGISAVELWVLDPDSQRLVSPQGGWWRNPRFVPDNADALARLEDSGREDYVPAQPIIPGAGLAGKLWMEVLHPKHGGAGDGLDSTARSTSAGDRREGHALDDTKSSDGSSWNGWLGSSDSHKRGGYGDGDHAGSDEEFACGGGGVQPWGNAGNDGVAWTEGLKVPPPDAHRRNDRRHRFRPGRSKHEVAGAGRSSFKISPSSKRSSLSSHRVVPSWAEDFPSVPPPRPDSGVARQISATRASDMRAFVGGGGGGSNASQLQRPLAMTLSGGRQRSGNSFEYDSEKSDKYLAEAGRKGLVGDVGEEDERGIPKIGESVAVDVQGEPAMSGQGGGGDDEDNDGGGEESASGAKEGITHDNEGGLHGHEHFSEHSMGLLSTSSGVSEEGPEEDSCATSRRFPSNLVAPTQFTHYVYDSIDELAPLELEQTSRLDGKWDGEHAPNHSPLRTSVHPAENLLTPPGRAKRSSVFEGLFPKRLSQIFERPARPEPPTSGSSNVNAIPPGYSATAKGGTGVLRFPSRPSVIGKKNSRSQSHGAAVQPSEQRSLLDRDRRKLLTRTLTVGIESRKANRPRIDRRRAFVSRESVAHLFEMFSGASRRHITDRSPYGLNLWRDLRSLSVDPDHPTYPRLAVLEDAGFAQASGRRFRTPCGAQGIVLYYARADASPSILTSGVTEAYLQSSADYIGATFAFAKPRAACAEARKERERRRESGVAGGPGFVHADDWNEVSHGEVIAAAWAKWVKTWIRKCGGGDLQPPPPFTPCQTGITWFGTFVTLEILGKMSEIVKVISNGHYTLQMGPLGALMCLQYGLVMAPASQPRSALYGQFSAIAITLLMNRALKGDTIPERTCVSLAVASSIAFLVRNGITHPPAGAAAIIAATGGFGWINLAIFLVGNVIAIVIATLINNISNKRQYPTFWHLGFFETFFEGLPKVPHVLSITSTEQAKESLSDATEADSRRSSASSLDETRPKAKRASDGKERLRDINAMPRVPIASSTSKDNLCGFGGNTWTKKRTIP